MNDQADFEIGTCAESSVGLCDLGAPLEDTDLERFFEIILPAREEIASVAHKLWLRHYVDGNAGNISCRVGRKYVLCTPTMVSKGDVTSDDLCLLDLEGNQHFGQCRRTSEILLHLAIYRANAAARAVVHCHPPHATAFAITGQAPPVGVLAEEEIFVGPIAFAPYETPGSRAFAETILPFVSNHNTILLANHGLVCWADTVSHAEWCVEVVDAYCRTVILAGQLGRPLQYIPPDKLMELLDLKRRVGLPDARLLAEHQPEPGGTWRF